MTVGARRDGRLTALALDVLSETGAYGNHAGGVLHHGCNEVLAAYACPNKRVKGGRSTPTPCRRAPSGAMVSARRSSPSNPPSTRWRGGSGSTFALRRINAVRPGDALVAHTLHPHDVRFGSYGLDQCLDLAERALDADPGPAPEPGWRTGTGMAMAMIDTIPPRGHFAEAKAACWRTAPTGSGSAPPSSAQRQPDRAPAVRGAGAGCGAGGGEIQGADTDAVGHDTGAYGSTGTVVGGMAVLRAAEGLALAIRETAGARLGTRPGGVPPRRRLRRKPRGSLPLSALAPLEAEGRSDGTPRSVAFNVQAFRVAVHPVSGEVQILKRRARGRCRRGGEPAAVPRPDRGRDRPGAGRGALRGCHVSTARGGW